MKTIYKFKKKKNLFKNKIKTIIQTIFYKYI